MRSMTRMAVAGLVALATLSAVAVLDVGSATAEAAPTASPLAGTYAVNSWTIRISDGGRITGSYLIGHTGGEFSKGSLSGRVSDDGSFSFTVNENGAYCWDERCRNVQRWKSSYQVAGNMGLDPNGNIVGTTNDGGSIYWIRQ